MGIADLPPSLRVTPDADMLAYHAEFQFQASSVRHTLILIEKFCGLGGRSGYDAKP